MSGQWSFHQTSHVGFIVEFDDRILYFNDQRRFGTIKFVSNKKLLDEKLSSLGPDILSDVPMTSEIFAKRILNKPNKSISEILMDQSCISGCGNYLKSEALYRAGISPHRNVIELKSREIYKLYEELHAAARESYKDQGASIRTYKTFDNITGNAQFFFRVYGLKNCPLGHLIKREETNDGRTSWWCESCQE